MCNKMNRFIRIFFILFLFVSTLNAQEYNSRNRHSFLWKVESKTTTVYILGSVHALKENLYPLDMKIENAFDTSDILAVEVNIQQVDQASLQNLILQNSLYPGDETLKDHISQETYARAQGKLGEYGLPIDQLNKFKPSFLALTITGLELQKLGFDPNLGIDKYFLEKSRGKKKIVELETSDFQIQLFSNLSEKEQELFLLYTLIDLDTIREQLNTLIEAWKTGDTKTMDFLVSKSLTDHPDFHPIYEKFIYKRNGSMAAQIAAFLQKEETYFIVVGAAHLVGERGIISLLKKKGFSVEQL